MKNLINITNKEGKLVVSSREVAVNFEKRHTEVLRKIDTLIAEMDSTQNCVKYFIPSEYVDLSGKSNKEYLLTRDGFSLLVMGFTGQRALQWKLKYIEAFNSMEQTIKQQLIDTSQLSPELQMFNSMFKAVANVELENKQIKQEIQNMRDVITLDTTSWREDSRKLIVKIAKKLGGNSYIREVNTEIYTLLNKRFGVDLKIRLTNKRNRMAGEGVCKSKRDKLNFVDVIAEDKKLIEGYVAIVKEMAIKYGVA